MSWMQNWKIYGEYSNVKQIVLVDIANLKRTFKTYYFLAWSFCPTRKQQNGTLCLKVWQHSDTGEWVHTPEYRHRLNPLTPVLSCPAPQARQTAIACPQGRNRNGFHLMFKNKPP
jgi:hypothetical protein